MKRFLLIAAGLLVVLAVAAALILPKYLNPEMYRARIESALGDATGRAVTIGPMRLHVFPLPGITAEGLSLGEDPAFGTEPFLKAERIDARVRLMPLFSKRLDVVSFDIEKPVAQLHRTANGKWNLVSLIERAGAKESPEKAAEPGGTPLDVVIERLRLVGGTLNVTDEAIIPGTTHRIEGRQIDLTLSDFSSTSPVGVDLKLGLTGSGKGALKGRLGPPPAAEGGGWPIDARVTITNFIGGAAAPYLATYTGVRLQGGSLDLDATLTGTAPQTLDVRGTVSLRALELAVSGVQAGKPLKLDGSVTLDGSFTPTKTVLRKADVKIGGATVTLSGTLDDLKGHKTADVRAVTSKVALKDVAPLLSQFGSFFPVGLALKGDIAIDATARGPLDDPTKLAIDGKATVAGLEYSDPSLTQPVKEIAATLALKGDHAELTGLTAALGRSKVQGSCTIKGFARPIIDVDLKAPLLDVDEILTFLPASGKTPPPPSNGAAPSMLGQVTLKGELAVGEVKAMNLKLTAAHARIDMSEGEARLHEVAATLYGGTLAGDVAATLTKDGPPFALKTNLEKVDFNALATDFSKDLKGLLYGTLESSLDVKGQGLDPQGLRSNLTGSASLALRNGKLTSFGFLKQMAQALQAVGGRGIGKDETPFSALTGTFDIRSGRATTHDLKLDSPNIAMNGKGSVGLDQTLAMDVGVLLSTAASADMIAKTPKLKTIANGKGELAVDLKVGGTLQKPSIGVDPNMLKRVAEDTLKKKAGDALRHLLDKKKH